MIRWLLLLPFRIIKGVIIFIGFAAVGALLAIFIMVLAVLVLGL